MTKKRALTAAEEGVLAAIRSFSFSNYGCDEMDELVSDESLDVGPALAQHIAEHLRGKEAGA